MNLDLSTFQFNRNPIATSIQDDGSYKIGSSEINLQYPGVNDAYDIFFRSYVIDEFSTKEYWGVDFKDYRLPYFSKPVGASPEKSLKKTLELAEGVLHGRVGRISSASGAKSFSETKTHFDTAPSSTWWTGTAISPHFFGSNVASLKNRLYKKGDNSTDIKSVAMLNDLELSLGIGRFSAIEVLSCGELTRGILLSVEECWNGFVITVRLFYTDGNTSERLHTCGLNQPFKISKRHLNGQWIEVLPK